MSEQSLAGKTLGPYALDRMIGVGGCGSVYRAHRTSDGPGGAAGTLLALKVFHPEVIGDERIFQRFEREAELGMRIRHAHIVPTLECGAAQIEDKTLHYMAMEFVEGETLREVLTELGTVPEDLLYQIADQILDALAAIHGEGMIHRDVKPENIILTGDQQVRLMDLGVARLQQEGCDLTLGGEFVGSLAYASPEQFIDQEHVDPRADIYACGVLLYEMGTGVNPYDDPSLKSLIEKKVRIPVRRPRLINRDLDPFLDDVIQTCLRISPDERFASCEELRGILAAGYEGAWWQGRIKGEAFPAATRALRRLRPPREAPLVGRDEELAGLHDLFEKVREGGGAVALLSGPAGIGKSRLAHDFLEDLMAPDGPVLLAGRCPEEAVRARHPFLEAVRGYLGEREGAEERLSSVLPGSTSSDAGVLAAAVFGEATEQPDADVDALVGVFLRGLANERAVVLVIEDLQRGDPESVALFDRLARALADTPVLLVATWRPEEVEDGSALHAATTVLAAQASTHSVVLPGLDREGVEALLTALVAVPSTVRALRWPLTRASSGNPQILLAMVEHLRDAGDLIKGEGGWTPTRPIEEVALPEDIRVLLLLRLVEVEPALMELLEAASAQGPEFDATLLAAVTKQKRLRLLKRLALLERKHGILQSSGRSAFQFASHGLWQVIYEGMRPERRRECHALSAEAMRPEGESLSDAAAHAWVSHMLSADQMDAALDLVPAAADYAATQIHALRGTRFLDRLATALEPDQSALRLDVLMQLATLHGLLGQTEEERGVLEQAAKVAEALGDEGPRGQLAARRAGAFLRAGDLEQAEAEAERALGLATEVGDLAGRAHALHTLGDIALRTGEYKRSAATWREALALRQELGDKRGEAVTSLRLGRVLPEIGERDGALTMREAALASFREAGDRRGEAAALNTVGDAWVERGRIAEAIGCYETSLAIVHELGDLPAEAHTLHNIARSHAIESRIEEACATFRTALDIFRQLGDARGEAATLDQLGSALASFGDHGPALKCLEEAQEAATRTGDRAVLARVLCHLANVHHEVGEVEEAWRSFEAALEVAPQSARSATLADMGNAALSEGDSDRAAVLLEESRQCAEGDTRQLVSLCRLARARHDAGRAAEARTHAARIEEMIASPEAGIAPHYAPEVYYTLATVLEGEERSVDYLVKANALLTARTNAIRTVVYREHYLTTRWPNREIIKELRELS